MKRDTTLINPSADCLVVIDDQTINAYDSTNKETYKTVSDQYVLISTETNQPQPVTAQCYTIEQVNDFPSRYEFIEPIYHLMAIVSAIFIFWCAYRLLLYPFFRKNV